MSRFDVPYPTAPGTWLEGSLRIPSTASNPGDTLASPHPLPWPRRSCRSHHQCRPSPPSLAYPSPLAMRDPKRRPYSPSRTQSPRHLCACSYRRQTPFWNLDRSFLSDGEEPVSLAGFDRITGREGVGGKVSICLLLHAACFACFIKALQRSICRVVYSMLLLHNCLQWNGDC